MGYPPLESLAFSFVLGVATGLLFVPRPDRSRVIPKRVRQAVIERDLKGAKFDATIHHIDHIVPFSKGGDNSPVNLRVLPKRENLSRGAKMPTNKDFRKRKIT
jgi:5-methylcytosine-specific restriction endonuclease McrA